MSRYIDADKLRKDEIARCHCVPCVGSNDNNWKDLDEVLDEIPTANVEEVRHGRWILKDNNGNGVCSVCNRQDKMDELATHCRYCGAKMDGGREENEG